MATRKQYESKKMCSMSELEMRGHSGLDAPLDPMINEEKGANLHTGYCLVDLNLRKFGVIYYESDFRGGS